MRILLVEDDRALATTVAEALRAGSHEVQIAPDGATALDATGYDLVLLDFTLPDLDGREVCRLLRARHPELPIIIVSAAGDEIDRVLGFELGADDYLVKPFSVRELLVRIRALARRAGVPGPTEQSQHVGRVRIDRRARRVFLDGEEVHLTTKEFDVLGYLCEDPGAARERRDIIEHVWGGQWFGPTKTLDAHVASIRRKLRGGLAITALRGVGFRVDAEA
ncbi:MAG: response regulator transcription factor [Acidimicrobiia bacterium]